MIKKILFQGFLLIGLLALIWFGLSRIDFMKWFDIEQTTINTEEKLGDMLWESIEKSEKIVRNDSILNGVDSLVGHLLDKNDISRKKIKVHVIEKAEVNAFAFPGNHLVVYTGLINECRNETELAGVLAHEIAHIEKRHVMEKLVREIGLAAILSIAGGDVGMIGEVLRTLTSSAYDRSLETEADLTAADYLIKAKMSPEPFAELMFRLAAGTDMPDALYWVSTHPESEERAKAILTYSKKHQVKPIPVLRESQWTAMKNAVK